MKWKTTLALLVLALGVGTYVSLYELKQPSPEERQALTTRILHLSPEELTSLTVELPHAKVTLKKDGETWRLTSPLSVRAEASLVQRILSQLEWLDAERVLSGTKEKPLDRAAYGLAPAHGSVTVSTKSLATTLLFGDQTAVGQNRYLARTDQSQIFVVGANVFDTLDQSVELYRSHELVGVDTTTLAGLTVSSPHFSYALTKEHGQWQLAQPIKDAADATAVGTLLNDLRNLRIERFLAEQVEVSAHPEWGFQTPTAKITLTLEQRATPLEILVGSGTNDNAQQRYAMRSDEPALYAVTGAQVEKCLKDPQLFRATPPPPAVSGAGESAGELAPSAATPSGESAPPTLPTSTKTDHAPAASR